MRPAVIDQPGLKVMVAGILLPLFLGLAIRSQLTPNKVHNRVQKYFDQISKANPDKKMKIDFEGAEIRLSEWGLPSPHLQLKEVRISFEDQSCDENQIVVDSAVIPIDWKWIFTPKDIHPSLRFGLVEVRTSEIKRCLNIKETESAKAAEEAAQGAVQESMKSTPSESVSITEQKIFIEKLRFVDKVNYKFPINLQSVNLNLFYEKNKVHEVRLAAQFFSMKDYIKNIFRLKGDLNVQYYTDRTKNSKIQLSGKVINKKFDFVAEYDAKSNLLPFKLDVDSISVKTLVSSMGQEGQNNLSVLNSLSGLSISFNSSGRYDVGHSDLEPIKIENLKVFSNDSDVQFESFSVIDLKPLKLSPIKAKITKWNLSEVFKNLNWPELNRSINNFGLLSGDITYSNEKFSSRGTLSDVALIFSNKGKQALHKVNQVVYDVTADRSSTQLKLGQFVMEDVAADGNVSFEWSNIPNGHEFKEQFLANGSLKKISLNSNVVQLFAEDEMKSESKVSVDLKINVSHGDYKGFARLDGLQTQKYKLSDLSMETSGSLNRAEEARKYAFNLAAGEFSTSAETQGSLLNDLLLKFKEDGTDIVKVEKLDLLFETDVQRKRKTLHGSFFLPQQVSVKSNSRKAISFAGSTEKDKERVLKIKTESKPETPQYDSIISIDLDTNKLIK